MLKKQSSPHDNRLGIKILFPEILRFLNFLFKMKVEQTERIHQLIMNIIPFVAKSALRQSLKASPFFSFKSFNSSGRVDPICLSLSFLTIPCMSWAKLKFRLK